MGLGVRKELFMGLIHRYVSIFWSGSWMMRATMSSARIWNLSGTNFFVHLTHSSMLAKSASTSWSLGASKSEVTTILRNTPMMLGLEMSAEIQ